jgi:hypothetical protein
MFAYGWLKAEVPKEDGQVWPKISFARQWSIQGGLQEHQISTVENMMPENMEDDYFVLIATTGQRDLDNKKRRPHGRSSFSHT